MFPKSIRWQLPLSYAAIALLATLALGLVLTLTLRSYYARQEIAYLARNAATISNRLAPLIESNLPPDALTAQLTSFAFLSQAQVRYLDPEGQAVADSGQPHSHQDVLALSVEVDLKVEGDATMQTITRTLAISDTRRDYAPVLLLKNLVPSFDNEEEHIVEILDEAEGDQTVMRKKIVGSDGTFNEFVTVFEQDEEEGLASVLAASGSPYGFELGDPLRAETRRSAQIVSQPVYNDEGSLLGYVELSNGPAYGQQILESVLLGWLVAGAVAVLLAAVVGWLVSRRISQPLLTLTAVTTQMAQGNLSVRAEPSHSNLQEVNTLAHTFNHMADQVEETVLTLRRFVADAAHELHTPLTALRTNLELVGEEEGTVNDNRQQFLERAQAQIVRLEALTTDLLELSRLETDVPATAWQPVSITELVQEGSELSASQAEQAGLVFTVELPDDLLTISGDKAQLRRALSNLLDNALKFTPEGGRITLGACLINEGAGSSCQIWVEDSGIGIPAEELPQLFSRFHRARNAVAYPGSGLGLAIVKAIVEKHGGWVAAESGDEHTRFTITLPYLKPGQTP